jgi:hypothetical protein
MMLLAPKQRGTDDLLESPDLLAQGGLNRVQPFGCSGEVQCLSNRDEVSQIS